LKLAFTEEKKILKFNLPKWEKRDNLGDLKASEKVIYSTDQEVAHTRLTHQTPAYSMRMIQCNGYLE
jgi:hypothetical protein